MKSKKLLGVLSFVMLLGPVFLAASGQNQAQDKNKIRNEMQVETKSQLQNRLKFRDENGDGICDGFRDHDGDGVPNGQDPEWTRPRDGKGNQSGFGRNSGKNSGFRRTNKWNKRTFRQSRAGSGPGGCARNVAGGNSRRGGKK